MSQSLDEAVEKIDGLEGVLPDGLKKPVTSVTPVTRSPFRPPIELTLSIEDAEAIAGKLSRPSKMPCPAYGLPAAACMVGSALRKVPGSVCSGCYAMKGRYVFGRVKGAYAARLAAVSHPQWAEAMVTLIWASSCSYFRWHDSGDIQSAEHLEAICHVATRLPAVKFWLPTQEYALVAGYLRVHSQFPSNLAVRLSSPMVDKPPPDSFSSYLTSGVVTSGETCPSNTTRGKCDTCRACWDKSVKHVTYRKH